MKLPRIKILALGGTIATRPDASGAMQMGLGAEDLVAAVPALATLAAIDAETVSRVGSHSLGFDQIHALAARIAGLDADGVIVTQGTDTLEETAFLLDLLLDRDIPGQCAPMSIRNTTGLFGHDHYYGIGFLTQTHGCPVAGAQ